MNLELGLLIIIIGGLIAIYFLFHKQHTTRSVNEQSSFILIQNQINEISRVLDNRLNESTRLLHHKSDQSLKIIQEVTEKLVKLDETNKQIVGFADQLQNLQDILKNPKQRGILGEYFLESLLSNILPPSTFQMQYSFKNGTIVDAVIFIKDQIIPIDSKFSLDNYNRIIESQNKTEREVLYKQFRRDLKERIDETSKYIQPSEKTMDFAFMFIPAEAIYYDLLINRVGTTTVDSQDLVQYAARDKHVIIVSPTSLLAYLQTVLQGLRALKIEESAKEIRKRVEELRKHLLNYDLYMKKLGNNLETTVSMYHNANTEFNKIDKDILRITGQPLEISSQEAENLNQDRDSK